MKKKEIIIQLKQEDRLVTVSEHQSVLEAALATGVQLIHSCLKGQCGSCRAMLVSGEVEMKNNASLFDEEIRQGQILLCQSYPLTEHVTVNPIRQPRIL